MAAMLTDILLEAQALIERVRGGPLREKGLKAGLTTKHDLHEMAEGWERWAAQDNSSLSMLPGEILIQK